MANMKEAARKRALDQEVADWNNAHAVGTRVVLKRDGVIAPVVTETRSAASILGGHSAVIWLKGVSGCYLLDRVKPARTPEEEIKSSRALCAKFAPKAGFA